MGLLLAASWRDKAEVRQHLFKKIGGRENNNKNIEQYSKATNTTRPTPCGITVIHSVVSVQYNYTSLLHNSIKYLYLFYNS